MALYGDDIWARALDEADMTNSLFPDAARKADYVNDAMSDLYYAMSDSGGEWFRESATIPIVSGTGSYTLPDGTLYSGAKKFYKAMQVYLKVDTRRYIIPKYMRTEISGYEIAPLASADLELLYVPAYIPLTAATMANPTGTDLTTLYPAQWEKFAVAHIASRLLRKEESIEAAQMAQADRDRAMGSILANVSPRDLGTPERIEDVTHRWRRGYLIAGWPRNVYLYRIEGANLFIIQPRPIAWALT